MAVAAKSANHARGLRPHRRSRRAPMTPAAPKRTSLAALDDQARALWNHAPIPERDRDHIHARPALPGVAAAACDAEAARDRLPYDRAGRDVEIRFPAPRRGESLRSAIRPPTFRSGARRRGRPHGLLDGDL